MAAWVGKEASQSVIHVRDREQLRWGHQENV